MTTYILIISNSFGDLTSLNNLLSDQSVVVEKKENINCCYFLKSPIDNVNELANKIQVLYPGKRFLVMDMNGNRQGWLPRDTWAFLREE